MAVSDHIKIASAELMKAADLVKVEIESLRRQETDTRIELEGGIAERLRQIQHLEYESRHSDNPQQRAGAQTAIAQLQSDVARMRAQLREQQRNIENAINQKRGMVNGLESQARAML